MNKQTNEKSRSDNRGAKTQQDAFPSESAIHPYYFPDQTSERERGKKKENTGGFSSYVDPQDNPNFYRKTWRPPRDNKDNSHELDEGQKIHYRHQIEEYQERTRYLITQKQYSKNRLRSLLIVSSFMGAALLYVVSLADYGSSLLYTGSILVGIIFATIAFGAALGIVGWSFGEIITKTNVLR